MRAWFVVVVVATCNAVLIWIALRLVDAQHVIAVANMIGVTAGYVICAINGRRTWPLAKRRVR